MKETDPLGTCRWRGLIAPPEKGLLLLLLEDYIYSGLLVQGQPAHLTKNPVVCKEREGR